MTCIIGLETEGAVFVAGDSGATNGYDGYRSRLKKVFRRGPFLIGYTTSFRMGQILQYQLEVPRQAGGDDLKFMATNFIDAVRKCLKDGGFSEIDNNREEGGTFLVGYRGCLYDVDSDFQVNSSQDGHAAVGSGYMVARGAMYVTAGLDTRKRLRMALKAAEHFSISVRGPFYVRRLANP